MRFVIIISNLGQYSAFGDNNRHLQTNADVDF